MNTNIYITKEQALSIAVRNVGIESSEYRCMSNNYDRGFYRIIVWSPYLKYEIYVDAWEGAVAGIDTAPVPYQEALCFCDSVEDSLTHAA